MNIKLCTYISPINLAPGECCHASLEGFSYCVDHYPVVYKEGSGLRKRHKDIRVANAVWDLENDFREVVEELEEEGVIEL